MKIPIKIIPMRHIHPDQFHFLHCHRYQFQIWSHHHYQLFVFPAIFSTSQIVHEMAKSMPFYLLREVNESRFRKTLGLIFFIEYVPRMLEKSTVGLFSSVFSSTSIFLENNWRKLV